MTFRNVTIAIASLAFATVTAVAAESSRENRAAGPTVAVDINGTQFTIADVERKNPTALFQASNTYFEAQRKAMEEFVDQYLLEQQARKEGLTVPALLEKHVNAKLPPEPSEEALRVYFEGIDTTEPYEAIRGKIIDVLRERRLARAKKAYLQSLRSDATIAVRIAPPRAPIPIDNAPYRGVPNAPVVLVEYADYECPYCQQIQPAIEKLEAEFKGKLALVYKDVPLPMHANAQKAAEATRCAEAQGKYWEFHDILMAKKQLAIPAMKQFARELRMDGESFDKCLDSGAKADSVKVHLQEAQMLGIQGTPTFFLNGRSFTGTPGYEQLRATIEEEWSRLSGNNTQQAATR